jgi:hypothetical protein
LQVPVPFFFEGAPHLPGQPKSMGDTSWPEHVTDFFASSNGLALAMAFAAIKNAKLRRYIVDLVEELAEQ